MSPSSDRAVRLWVVDHPSEVEVASRLKVVPGERQPVGVLAARGLRPVAAAWDGRGEDVTARVRAEDEQMGEKEKAGEDSRSTRARPRESAATSPEQAEQARQARQAKGRSGVNLPRRTLHHGTSPGTVLEG